MHRRVAVGEPVEFDEAFQADPVVLTVVELTVEEHSVEVLRPGGGVGNGLAPAITAHVRVENQAEEAARTPTLRITCGGEVRSPTDGLMLTTLTEPPADLPPGFSFRNNLQESATSP